MPLKAESKTHSADRSLTPGAVSTRVYQSDPTSRQPLPSSVHRAQKRRATLPGGPSVKTKREKSRQLLTGRFISEPGSCIILLDLYLPIYDGIAILRAIRAAPALEHIHVMVLSGLASPSQEAEIATLGAVYRPKPFALDQLCGLAAEILEICRSWTTALPVTR